MMSSPLQKYAALAIALSTCLLAAGCSDSPSACETSRDCFGGEACVAGVCQPQSSADAGNNATPDDTSSNEDTSSNNNSGEDTSTNNGGEDASSGETCEVDPFEVECDNDDDYDNDEWIDADEFKDTTLGCYGSLEKPEDWSTTIDGVKCYDEAGDYFGMNIAPCDTQFRFEAKLTVPQMCTDTQWGLEARVGGAIIECDEERDYMAAQCSREGNTETWTILVKPSLSIWSVKFGVLGAEDADTQFDYTLEGYVR